jgi:phospholipase/carboxylesterase
VPRLDIAGLSARVEGPADADLTVVLLHGFGASGDDLVALGSELGVRARYVFPAAPLALPGIYGDARAWWMIDLAAFEGGARDFAAIPAGFLEARRTVSHFLDELAALYAITPDRLVLGGFSQGSMMVLDAALTRAAPPAGLLLFSTTLVAEPEWAPRFGQLAGVPVMMSHGRADPILPFAAADALRQRLAAAGASVSWVPFGGGHEIPMPALTAAQELLRTAAR